MNRKIYWEKQGIDMLCGVHCISSLLQGIPLIIQALSLTRSPFPNSHWSLTKSRKS